MGTKKTGKGNAPSKKGDGGNLLNRRVASKGPSGKATRVNAVRPMGTDAKGKSTSPCPAKLVSRVEG